MALLIRGLRGQAVKLLQEKLGIDADGVFGGGTEKAVKAYQEEHGLAADGMAGAETFASMGLYELVLLKRGSKGALVEKLQAALQIDADGKFGKGTEAAVSTYQESNGLKVDGKAGPETLSSLGVFEAQALAATGAEAWGSVEEATSGALDKIKGFFA